jgi:hypothetical protein
VAQVVVVVVVVEPVMKADTAVTTYTSRRPAFLHTTS